MMEDGTKKQRCFGFKSPTRLHSRRNASKQFRVSVNGTPAWRRVKPCRGQLKCWRDYDQAQVAKRKEEITVIEMSSAASDPFGDAYKRSRGAVVLARPITWKSCGSNPTSATN